jgi:hypothetical protein
MLLLIERPDEFRELVSGRGMVAVTEYHVEEAVDDAGRTLLAAAGADVAMACLKAKLPACRIYIKNSGQQSESCAWADMTPEQRDAIAPAVEGLRAAIRSARMATGLLFRFDAGVKGECRAMFFNHQAGAILSSAVMAPKRLCHRPHEGKRQVLKRKIK